MTPIRLTDAQLDAAFEPQRGDATSLARRYASLHEVTVTQLDGPSQPTTTSCTCGWTGEPTYDLAQAYQAAVEHRDGPPTPDVVCSCHAEREASIGVPGVTPLPHQPGSMPGDPPKPWDQTECVYCGRMFTDEVHRDPNQERK